VDVDYIPLAQYWSQWQDFVKRIMNIWFQVLSAVVIKSSIFWDITPRSPLKVSRHIGGLLAARDLQVSCLSYSSILNMKATWSSETSVVFQHTVRRYIPEDRTIHYKKAFHTLDHAATVTGKMSFLPYLNTVKCISHVFNSHDEQFN
jgi:hypothetical protein